VVEHRFGDRKTCFKTGSDQVFSILAKSSLLFTSSLVTVDFSIGTYFEDKFQRLDQPDLKIDFSISGSVARDSKSRRDSKGGGELKGGGESKGGGNSKGRGRPKGR